MDRKLSDLAAIMDKLRDENGCPWDREQTHESLKQYLLEEAYEVIEAIESGDDAPLKEELGDVLFQIIFHSRLAKEKGLFTIEDVITGVCEKMERRHPHVFGNDSVKDSGEVLSKWEEIKKAEKKRDSLLDGVPKNLPSLIRSKRIQQRAARVGFDWPRAEDVWKKVEEEFAELKEAWEKGDRENMDEEMGDLMMTLVNLGRFIKVDADDSLKKSIKKFVRRFKRIEKELEGQGKDIHNASLDEMEEIWNKVRLEDKNCRPSSSSG